MSKPWHEKPLWEKVFMAGDRVYLPAGKIINHLGIHLFGYYDAAKLLPDYNKLRYENAVRDLTVYAKREQGQYELTEHAKKVLWIIIGPPPGHPEYVKWWRGRLVSVRKMREEGTEPEFAVEPPVPLEPAEEKPAEPPPKKRTRRKRAG